MPPLAEPGNLSAFAGIQWPNKSTPRVGVSLSIVNF